MNGGDWLDAQYSVLGCMLLWPELVPRVLLETSEADFSGPCLTVYQAIKRLDGENVPVDPVSVNAALNKSYGDFLAQLMEIVPTSASIDRYIGLCREQSRMTAIRNLAQQITLAQSGEEMEKLLEQANGYMVDRPSLRITNMQKGLSGFYEQQTTQPNYLSWPMQELNDRLYARPGSFIVVGGTPSTGKSAWALQCAVHFAQSCKVGFFSLETSNDILFDRLMASVPELSMDEIQRHDLAEEGWAAVARESSRIIQTDLDLISAAGFSPADIRSVTTMKKYKVIFVDYLQLVQGTGSNRAEQVAGISMALHTMAQSLGVTVIALSQLKRKDGAQSPSMSDLRESGQIEQDADIVMILQLEDETEPNGPRGLYIAKNKEGRRFKMTLAFDGRHQTFSKARVTGEPLNQPAGRAGRAYHRPHGLEPPDPPDQMPIMLPNTKVPFLERKEMKHDCF